MAKVSGWANPGKLLGAAAVAFLLPCAPAFAQYAPVDPIPLGQTATGVMANKLSGDIARGESSSNAVSSRCLADSGPGPERRAMEGEYARRLKSAGKAGADAWRAEHGRAYRARLVAAGKCPASAGRYTRAPATKAQPGTRPPARVATRECSADAVPAADRRRMETEYVRRAKADGKASADAWVRAEGVRFHRKLVAAGICPA